MEDMRVNENANWVKVRSACSAEKVFRALEAAVRADVEARIEVREGEGIKFEVKSELNTFSVIRETAAAAVSVEFSHDATSITALVGKAKIRATLTMNDEGLCRFYVNGEELEGWQFRRRALEALFFE